MKKIVDRGYSVQEVSQRQGVSSHSLYKGLKASGRWGEKVQTDEMESMRQENLRLKAELKRAACGFESFWAHHLINFYRFSIEEIARLKSLICLRKVGECIS